MTLLVQFLHQHAWVASILIQMEIVFQMSVFQKLTKNVSQVKFQMDLEAALLELILSLVFLHVQQENF